MALDDGHEALSVDVREFVRREASRPRAGAKLGDIPVVTV
jgi:hypothetical protein